MDIEELVLFRIRKARKQLDLTQLQAAELVGVSQNAWATYENGRRSVSLRMLQRISRAFNMPFEYFVLADYEHVVKEAVPKAEAQRQGRKKKAA